MTAVDYSFARPSIASLKAAGVKAVGRYVGPASWGKTITQGEFDSLTAAGIEVWLVFEESPHDAEGGYAAGVNNARLAKEWIPKGYSGPIFFAVDESVSGPAFESAVAYIHGASVGMGSPALTGDYGEGDLLEATNSLGYAINHWQSDSNAFPGSVTTTPVTNIQQRAGSPVAGTDDDVMVRPFIRVPVSSTPAGGIDLSNFPNAIGAALTSDGQGAWVVGTDGGVDTAGDAPFHGCSHQVNPAEPAGGDNAFTPAAPIIGIVPTPDDGGYWLYGTDGGVYAFGNAPAHGSYPGLPPAARQGDRSFGAGSLVVHPDLSYTLVALDGARYGFGG